MRIVKRIIQQRLPDRDEVGAVAVVVGAISLVLVLIAAFAVDIGMQRVARRDMQSLSDVVALDLVRELDGRSVAVLDPLMPALAQASGDRNESTIGDPPTFAVELGELDPATGDFTAMSGADIPTAVKVTSSTSVDFSFTSGSGGANRSAVAALDSGACFELGSVGVGLDTSKSTILNGVIGGALGSNVNLSVLSYQGLASAGIDLASVLAVNNLGVGSVDELLTTEVSLVSFLNASATVLDNQGNVAEANIFRALALQSQSTSTVNLGNFITTQQGTTAAASASFDALSLLYGAVVVADGKNFVNVTGLGLNLGITQLDADVTVISPPQQICGKDGFASPDSTEQIEATVRGSVVNLGLPNVGALLGVQANIDVQNLTVAVATATGMFVDSQCGEPSVAVPDTISAFVTPGLITVNGTISAVVTARVGLVTVEITLPLTVSANPSRSGSPVDMSFTSLADYQNAYQAGSAGVGLVLTPNGNASVRILGGLDIGGVVANLALSLAGNLTSTLTTPLNNALVLPLIDALGVRVGSADVFGVPRPKCDVPSLKG